MECIGIFGKPFCVGRGSLSIPDRDELLAIRKLVMESVDLNLCAMGTFADAWRGVHADVLSDLELYWSNLYTSMLTLFMTLSWQW